ncbi:hypothetical protein [Flavobacterium sp. C4GT6]|uniref:hypothetical protein n=1 Tax=Flavobacterium sp. C4GT6 TaxID=3103818 RepID=UPI002ED32F31
MSLYVLNCCIDVPTPHGVKEDLTINKQESILELIIEKLMGFDDALAEYYDNDSDTDSFKKIGFDLFIIPSASVTQKKFLPVNATQNLKADFNSIGVLFFEIPYPPPEV